MLDRDQQMRRTGKHSPAVDRANTRRLKRIVSRYGWPHSDLVGADGAGAAWVLVQHADHDPAWQRQCLSLMRRQLRRGTVAPQHVACLMDRTRVNQGRPQLFGTQFFLDSNGKLVPRPIGSRRRLSARRKAYGLRPFSEYLRSMKRRQGAFVRRYAYGDPKNNRSSSARRIGKFVRSSSQPH
jgi:uncharacterized protein DUF6624